MGGPRNRTKQLSPVLAKKKKKKKHKRNVIANEKGNGDTRVNS